MAGYSQSRGHRGIGNRSCRLSSPATEEKVSPQRHGMESAPYYHLIAIPILEGGQFYLGELRASEWASAWACGGR